MIRYPTQRRYPLMSALDWLEDVWGGPDGGQGQVMPMDVRETDSGYIVEVGLPGIKPADVEVTLDGRLLTIRGRSNQDRDRDEGRYLLRERRSTSFSRSVTLPAEIDADRVATSFEDGELCVTLPISQRAGSRRIPVGSGPSRARSVGAGTDGGSERGSQAGDPDDGAKSDTGRDGQRSKQHATASAGATSP